MSGKQTKFKCSRTLDRESLLKLSDISCYVVDSKLYLDLFLQDNETNAIYEEQKSLINEGSLELFEFLDREKRIKLLIENCLNFLKHLKNINEYLLSGFEGNLSSKFFFTKN